MPPLADIVAAPLLRPLQLTFVTADTEEVRVDGCVIVTVLVILALKASVIVQVQVAAARPVAGGNHRGSIR